MGISSISLCLFFFSSSLPLLHHFWHFVLFQAICDGWGEVEISRHNGCQLHACALRDYDDAESRRGGSSVADCLLLSTDAFWDRCDVAAQPASSTHASQGPPWLAFLSPSLTPSFSSNEARHCSPHAKPLRQAVSFFPGSFRNNPCPWTHLCISPLSDHKWLYLHTLNGELCFLSQT